MRVAPGVNLDGLTFPLWYAAAIVDYVRQANGLGESTITSALDGQHTSGSVHSEGLAIDFRTRDIPLASRMPFAQAVREALGNEFFVALETNPPHLHVQQGFKNETARGLAEYGLA
jgi:hypothetical protein